MLEWSVHNPKGSGYDLQIIAASGQNTRILTTVRPGRSYVVEGARDVCVRRVAVPARILVSAEGEILPDTLPPPRGLKRVGRS